MGMVVTCRSCGAQFRLDEALLKDAKGARFRCRRCGGYILVMNPAAPPAAPASAAVPGIPPVPAKAPGNRKPPAPEERNARGTSLNVRVWPAPKDSPAEEDALPTPATAAPVPRDKPAGKVPGLEELFLSPIAADAGPNRSRGGPATKGTFSPVPVRKTASRSPWHSRQRILMGGLSVLLLAGGALYFSVAGSGKESPVKVSPERARSAAEPPAFDLRDVKGYSDKQANGQGLYVIKGAVANVGKAQSKGIRIHATLLANDNQAMMQADVFAGNLIEETLLPHMSRVRIEGFLGMRYGEGNANRDIPTGGSLPFMVVFFDPPERVESFTVKAMEADETGTGRAPAGKEKDARAFNQRADRPD